MNNFEEEHAIALSKIADVQPAIGYYFKDVTILYRAFTTTSFLNEHRGYNICDYQGLEYLGDAIIGSVVAKSLFDRYNIFSDRKREHMEQLYKTEEGYLTIVRSFFVGEEMLSYRMEKLGYAQYLLRGKGESINAKIRCDLFEAIIGAVMSDSNDYSSTRDVVVRMLDIDYYFVNGICSDPNIPLRLSVLYALKNLTFKRKNINDILYYIVYDKSDKKKEILREIDAPYIEEHIFEKLCNKGYGNTIFDKII